MALLPKTGLETHPTGTGGLNGIINGNWERVEEIFSDLVSADSSIDWDPVLLKFTQRAKYVGLTTGASITLDFAGASIQNVTLSANTTFGTANRKAGERLSVVVVCDGTGRTLTWPSGIAWVGGTAPASIAANKVGLLELISTTTSNSGVVARWTVQS